VKNTATALGIVAGVALTITAVVFFALCPPALFVGMVVGGTAVAGVSAGGLVAVALAPGATKEETAAATEHASEISTAVEELGKAKRPVDAAANALRTTERVFRLAALPDRALNVALELKAAHTHLTAAADNSASAIYCLTGPAHSHP